MKRWFYAIIMVATLSSTGVESAETSSAKATIEAFYQAYLPHTGTPRNPVKPAFSSAFQKLLDGNDKICREKAGSDVCGWGADGDPFLDAQEYEPKLTPASSGLKIREVKPGLIEVKLNVYPSYTDTQGYYDRVITYRMVQENNAWLVDDIIYKDGASSRQSIKKENTYYLAHPQNPAGK